MAGKQQLAGKLAVELLNQFPNTPTNTLSAILFRDNKKLFKDKESARTIIRYYRGTMGKRGKKGAEKEVYFRKGELNPFKLPESFAEDNDPYIIPESIKRLLVLSDIHFPYHDVDALTAAINYGKKRGVDGILLNGDSLDNHTLSRFDKDPRSKSFADELDSVMDFLKVLKKEFNCPIYFKLGNHEERYEKYLRVKAPEVIGVAEFQLDILLHFGEIGVELIQDQRIVMFGNLPIVHGHEFHSKATGQVNPARSLFTKAIHSAVVSHSHRSSSHTEPDILGEIITTWSTGCLCGLAPEYARINKWNHGFAYIEKDRDNFRVYNKRIFKGRVL